MTLGYLLKLIGLTALGFSLFVAFQIGIFTFTETAEAEIGSRDCTVTVSETQIVGADLSSVVLAESSRRAWAEIGIVDQATSTIYLGLAGDAVSGQGPALNIAHGGGVTTTPSIVFGKDTELPFTGAVEAITDAGSTTVRVTQCNY